MMGCKTIWNKRLRISEVDKWILMDDMMDIKNITKSWIYCVNF